MKTEIGDSKQEQFYPQVKLMKWGNESNFSVRYSGIDAVDKPVEEDGKIKIGLGNQEVHLYEKQVDFRNEWYKDKYPDDFFLGNIEATQDLITINGSTIAVDSEEERETLRLRSEEAYGDVLVVGLGLGLMFEYLRANPKVTSITCVEINQQVIDNIGEIDGVEIICADFYAWNTDRKFDYIYGDIFPSSKVGSVEDWQQFLYQSQFILKPNGIVKTYIDDYANKILEADFTEQGYELEVILNEVPDTNAFHFSLNSKDVDFFYQPALTEEERLTRFRPESVEESYAVYGKKRDGKYQTGKVAHIYRPKIYDANDDWVWGDLTIDGEDMTIVVDRVWLDNAVYPVRIDPTFGYTTIGASTFEMSNYIVGSKATGVSGVGNVIVIHLATGAINRSLNGAVYLQADDTQVTNSQTNQVTSDSNTWLRIPFTVQPTFTVTPYWIAVRASTLKKGTININYDTGAVDVGLYKFESYVSTMPDPLAGYTLDTSLYSMFVHTGSTSISLINDDF